MNTFTHVPPGFRFHPTDEELVDYYLRRKVSSKRIDLDVIKDVDLYKIEPWDLQELCRIGTDEQSDWYFFSHKDKKYPTGTRTNRATAAGFWKATGRDKAIYSKLDLIGMRKTLVFYKGRAPNGQKSDWIMHEYRLETDENGAPQEEGWVVCRVFKKRIAATQRFSDPSSPNWFDDQVSFMPDVESPKLHPYANFQRHNYPNYNNACKREMEAQYGIPPDQFLQLPLLESPKIMQAQTMSGCSPVTSYAPGPNMYPAKDHVQSSQQIHDQNFQSQMFANVDNSDHGVTDWRVLDKFVASQLSQDEIAKEKDAFPMNEDSNMVAENLSTQEMPLENTSTSSTGCPTNIWK